MLPVDLKASSVLLTLRSRALDVRGVRHLLE